VAQLFEAALKITPALRGSLYAPAPEDRSLLGEQALVDGLLVRKYKMLLEMQRERRRKRGKWSGTWLPWASMSPSQRADRPTDPSSGQRPYPKTMERSMFEKFFREPRCASPRPAAGGAEAALRRPETTFSDRSPRLADAWRDLARVQGAGQWFGFQLEQGPQRVQPV
jgi:hypothetical protein